MSEIPSKYASNTLALLEELQRELSEQDIDFLKSLGDAGLYDSVTDFLNRNEYDVEQYIRSSPSKRIKNQKWNKDANYRRLLIYSSSVYLGYGVALVEMHEALSICVGLGYREFAAEAAQRGISLRTEQLEKLVPSFLRLF